MDKLFSFHGIDHKVGVTMIAQSVAELIANERKDLKILLITLNGRKNAGYVKKDIISPILQHTCWKRWKTSLILSSVIQEVKLTTDWPLAGYKCQIIIILS